MAALVVRNSVGVRVRSSCKSLLLSSADSLFIQIWLLVFLHFANQIAIEKTVADPSFAPEVFKTFPGMLRIFITACNLFA